MLWFHKDGAEADYGRFGVNGGGLLTSVLWKNSDRKFGESKMEISFGGFVEDGLREVGGGFGGSGIDGPEDDIELRRRERSEEMRGGGEETMEFEGGGVAGLQVLRKLTTGGVRQKLLGGPKGDGRGSCTGTLQGDLSEMKIFGREIGVGGVVFVETADGRIAEENGAATVGLETVLVGVDDNGVDLGNGVEGSPGLGKEVGGEGEVAAIGGIRVNTEAIFLPEGEDLIERIDGAGGSCA
jgi:hypothetical protein